MPIKPVITHPWNLGVAEAVKLQEQLAPRVEWEDRLGAIRYVAGVDAAYDETRNRLFAAAVVLDADSLACIESAAVQEALTFPYIGGLFAFRELPAVIQALEKLNATPGLIVCDGLGVAHPRRFGLASHLGVLFDVPTIGCSKTRLLGEAATPGPTRGDRVALVDGGELVGCVLRTRDRVKPVCVSTGHRVALQTACDWILRLTPRYRLPETTRRADRAARRAKAQSDPI